MPDEQTIGVIVGNTLINQTDSLLGTPATSYPTGAVAGAGDQRRQLLHLS